ncbi:DNA mismatch endonuclease Vsr [Duncaniella sp. C9]|jgi:DNA mismatch endonuclease (patch repair protein)|uniref:very short patch repair endonuclease n=2 Tax=Bacteroidia TaxID=200643 RepID=UPI0010A376E4|nr:MULTISPECIES: very short patch repair endonuclease [Bacteroidales]QCD40156.1 DNA mismatch endonuclease Vsr [Duncaniella sp. C9]QCP71189.1 DNA mismatch endonuclease Vsr [Duncaniella sp. B8]
MADVKTPEQRSRNMAAIKGKDTKPEIIVRKYLFSRGLRFRVQVKKLPGNPDIVLPKYKTVIFVNGCLWHGHEGCKYFRLPKSNVEFWKEKIERNIERDRESMQALLDLRWKVIRVWECELRNKANREVTLNKIYNSITSADRIGYSFEETEVPMAAEPEADYSR